MLNSPLREIQLGNATKESWKEGVLFNKVKYLASTVQCTIYRIVNSVQCTVFIVQCAV